jgi:hypothetical protein
LNHGGRQQQRLEDLHARTQVSRPGPVPEVLARRCAEKVEMNARTRLLTLTLLAPLAAAAAGEVPRPPLGGMDADHDGVLTRAEHADGARAMFVMMDADRDERVTPAEMTAAQGRIPGTRPGAGPSSQEKIAAVDGDGDGMLTAPEHAAASTRMFTRMDRNGDGRLTSSEYETGHASLQGGAADGN